MTTQTSLDFDQVAQLPDGTVCLISRKGGGVEEYIKKNQSFLKSGQGLPFIQFDSIEDSISGYSQIQVYSDDISSGEIHIVDKPN